MIGLLELRELGRVIAANPKMQILSDAERFGVFARSVLSETYYGTGEIDVEVGHVIYRLSDFLGSEDRAKIVVNSGKDPIYLCDWREAWKLIHQQIPMYDVGWRRR